MSSWLIFFHWFLEQTMCPMSERQTESLWSGFIIYFLLSLAYNMEIQHSTNAASQTRQIKTNRIVYLNGIFFYKLLTFSFWNRILTCSDCLVKKKCESCLLKFVWVKQNAIYFICLILSKLDFLNCKTRTNRPLCKGIILFVLDRC